MSAALAAPLAAVATGRTELAPVLAALAALVIFLHRANIGRLLRGEEPRVGTR
jgi:glycerol-3-phosphate acyltransferase PlsY